MRASVVIALAASTAAEVVGYHPKPMFAPLPVVARGDSGCSELPKLCTDPVMFYGVVTTMTYLCPDKTNGLITVTVTTTGTTTVTEVPTDAVLTRTTTITEVPTDDIFAPSSSVAAVSVSEKPTTTISTTSTIKTTVEITVTKHVEKAAESLTPAPITWSFTAVLPSDAVLTPAPITDEFTAVLPSLTPGPITNEYTAVLPKPPQASPVDGSLDDSTSFSLFPSHSIDSSSVESSSSVASSPSAGYAVPIVSAPIYRNTTSHMFTKNAREADPTETEEASETLTGAATATTSSKGMAGKTRVSSIALFVGLMVAAFIL